MVARALLLLLASAALLTAGEFHTYIGTLESDRVLIAWGKTSGWGNTIGRESTPWGAATVRVGARTVTARQNQVTVDGLTPDTEYTYDVRLDGRSVGSGRFRTWAAKAERLTFFVIGDFGNASQAQRDIAQAMTREFERRRGSDSPVRFVLTTGDNVYGDWNLLFTVLHSGDRDRDWGPRFFEPYERVLGSIPFYPSPGEP